jgi:uncharacterized glyoxalase superfamily protein PhnB
VVDAQRSASFYCDVLGFDKDWEHRFAEGWPLYVSVSRGALTLHLSEHHDGETGGTELFVRVDDVDAVYAQLVDRGLVAESPPADQDYGVRDFHFTDPDGHRIGVGRRLESFDQTRSG